MMMTEEIKLRENVVVKIDGNQAEVIAEKSYKLLITLHENKVIATYGDITIIVDYNKFDAEKLARKIYVIVKQSHRFPILIIKEVLELIVINNLYDEIVEQIKKLKEAKDINALQKVYDFLRKI